MWVIVDAKMFKVTVRVPRAVYINYRDEQVDKGMAVKRTLPRLKTVHNLRYYTIEEGQYEASLK